MIDYHTINRISAYNNFKFWFVVNIIEISMENYFTFTKLLGLRDSEGANLPLFKDARIKRFQSVERILDLLEVAGSTRPNIPSPILTLSPLDRKHWITQLSGTTRCHSQSSSARDTGPTREEFPHCSYYSWKLVLLLLQLQPLYH